MPDKFEKAMLAATFTINFAMAALFLWVSWPYLAAPSTAVSRPAICDEVGAPPGTVLASMPPIYC